MSSPLPSVPEKNGRDPNNLQQEILRELGSVRDSRIDLLSSSGNPGWEYFILFCCILANGVFLFTRSDYVMLFVAASFYLNMGYFITLLIPTSPGSGQFSLPEINRFQSWLSENGIRTSTSQFTQVFVNAFFINSRALSPGIGLLFSIDILLVLVAFQKGLPLWTTLVVIGQSAIIILFYFLVWRTEPFTSQFRQNLDKVKRRLAHNLPPWFISFLFLTGFLLVVLVFLTTIILLPGMTLGVFLTQSGLSELAHLIFLVGILVVSQYFIIRYIHGIASREMAHRLMDHREYALQELLVTTGRNEAVSRQNGEVRYRFEETTALLESRIYVVKRNTLLGLFPVFVVDLDFSVLLDSTTMTVIRGYIRKT